MPANAAISTDLDELVVARLACPACYGILRAEGSHLICNECGRGYPIIDGIPALNAERAESAAK